MKVKKIGKFLLIWLCIMSLLMPFGAEVLAAVVTPITSQTETAQLETIAYRQGGVESSGTITSSEYDEKSYSYEISGVDVLKIVQDDDFDYTDMIYCVNGRASFPTSATNSFKYTNMGDFENSSDEDIVKWKQEVGISDENYNALVYLLNNIYLMKQNTSYKTEFIAKAFDELLKAESLEEGYDPPVTVENIMTYLTDDDIDTIQQWAIWYFTNGTNESNEYYESKFSDFGTMSVKYATYDTSTGAVSTQTDEVSGARKKYASTLYSYLISTSKTAVQNGYTAGGNSETATYPTLDKTKAITSEAVENYYKVGPYKVNSGNSIPSDYQLILTFNTAEGTIDLSSVNYKICDENGTEISLNNWEFDKEYYIYVPIENNTVTSITLTSNYTANSDRNISFWVGEDETGTYETLQPVVILTEEPEKVTDEVNGKIVEVEYDLALRKFVVSVDGEATTGREPVVSGLEELASGASKTAEYKHAKSPLIVSKGNKIVYEFRVYNEGSVDAKLKNIVDYIPNGLTVVDKTNSTINSKYNWSEEKLENGYTKITTDYLKDTTIPAFNKEELKISYVVLQVECEITGDLTSGTVLTNVAEILADDGSDRDSTEGSINPSTITDSFSGNTSNKSDLTDKDYYYKGIEDDDDFEKIVIDGDLFDLALKKFISKVNDKDVNREPTVDVTPLKTSGIDATYKTTKTPVGVETGDIVTFTIRVYNEGDIAGYAEQITDYIPEGLGFLVNYKTNYDNYWSISNDAKSVKLSTIKNGTNNLKKDDFVDVDNLSDVEVVLGGSKVTSKALSYSATSDTNLIASFDGEKLSYKDIQITCIVVTEDELTLKNIAAVTAEKDEDGNEITTDRDNPNIDSTPADDIDPSKYTTGNEDDDDYDIIKTTDKDFDLALQKFITGVNDEEITSRTPVLSTDEKGNIVYSHTSDALSVGNGDYITYTIRVYNEGDIEGYAAEVSDDIPTGLVFVPDNEVNKKYEWVMVDSSGNETTDVNQAVKLKTKYLSKESSEKNSQDNLLKAYDKEAGITSTNPDYRDVKLVFKVNETAISKTTSTEARTLINTAEITKNTDKDGNDIPDIDSTPGDGDLTQDDIDQEKVYVKYFDLSLKKDLNSAIITEEGNTTTVNVPAGEDTIRVEVNRKKVSQTTIQFVYYVTVTNEGEIAGYATEITDYIPNGLYFEAADNPEWTKVSDKIITTNALAKTLLQPGESASVKVVLRWEASSENTGKFVNIAEISEDWNEYNSDDVDSTPNNLIATEDDYDTAPVYVSIATGITDQPYIILTTTVLVILGTGIVLIKKYVM